MTSAAWLTSAYGNLLKKFMLDFFQPVVMLFSTAEPFFPGLAIDTVVLILEARAVSSTTPLEPIRFVTLRKPLANMLPSSDQLDYWDRVDRFTSDLETLGAGDHGDFRIVLLDAHAERSALVAAPKTLRNWSRPFKSTPIYQDLFT